MVYNFVVAVFLDSTVKYLFVPVVVALKGMQGGYFLPPGGSAVCLLAGQYLGDVNCLLDGTSGFDPVHEKPTF